MEEAQERESFKEEQMVHKQDAGIGLGVGIAFGSIPAGPAIMVGGTIGAAVGAATGMGVAAYEYYQETQPKGTVTVGPISAFAVDKSGNGYTDGTNYH